MAANRTLKAYLTGGLRTEHHRTNTPIAQGATNDNISYTDYVDIFTNGSGKRKIDLQYHARLTINNDIVNFDLDGGLLNVWGDPLDYDAVHLIIIRNRQTELGRYLQATFKDERYNIGPEGTRIITEPQGKGVEAFVTSTSSEEGQLTIQSDLPIEYDLIILGSSSESSEPDV